MGYGFASEGKGGFVGTGSFFDTSFEDIDYRKWLVSYCFCCTSCTIVSGALAERTFVETYLYFTLLMATLIYPIVACWVWGGGWLQALGFKDHGGAGLVHMTSGLAGMIGTYILGARLGIFKDVQPVKGTFEYTRL